MTLKLAAYTNAINMVPFHRIYDDIHYEMHQFYGGSDSKEPACNAGNPGSIPGSGKSPGEGISYPLQCFWASLVAKTVKNQPAMRETWV